MRFPTLFVTLLIVWAPTTLQNTEVFPATDTVTGAAPVDDFRRAWYTEHLIAMGETRLPERASSSGGTTATALGETYRFLWLRSFHHPIVIRLECVEKSCELTARRTDGQGGYEPGAIVERKARRLSEEEVARFQQLLVKTQFWRRQPSDVRTSGDRIGLDGAQWVLEGRRAQQYHLWDVWSPEPSGAFAAFRDLCLKLVRFSGLAVRPNEVY